MGSRPVLEWLLEEKEPSIRYLTLTQILGRPETDGEVQSAREKIGLRGWAAAILDRQDVGGWWVDEESLYRPKYTSTNWMLLVLSDLGLTKSDPRIERACQLWMDRFAKKDGGFSYDGGRVGHLCIVGNTARALVRFDYVDEPRVRSAFEWLVERADPKGGWNCFGKGRNLDSWEGLSAFAVYPRQKWNAGMQRVVEEGAEFFLERELHRQGARYDPWYRSHYPIHYYYDLLVGLDFLTDLGYVDDPRLAFALEWLQENRRKDDRWNLDAVHPDVEGSYANWFLKNPNKRPVPFALESPGEPSKMITLKALQILSRVDQTA